MKKRLLTLGLGISMILSLGTTLSAEEGKPLDQIPEKVEHTPFTVTRVNIDTNMIKLAELYYGDANDSKVIQDANKNLDMNISQNTEVKIPITAKFKDQPEQLSWN